MSLTRLINIGGMFSFGIFASYCMSDKNFDRFSSLVLPQNNEVEPIDLVKGAIVLPSLIPFLAIIDE